MSIQPFRIAILQEDLDDLQGRLERTRWPGQLPGAPWSRGVPVAYLQELAAYWRAGYDWRAQEARLNAFPQFLTEIDGQRLHFLHVRAADPGALPLLLSHGWPGSVAEFLRILGPLTDPAGHGGDPADAFHVVAPSLPGFAFSGPPPEPGWDTRRTAQAFAELMSRLGYGRYGAQGGDLGAIISPELGRVDRAHVVGIHVNAASVGFIPYGPVEPDVLDALTPRERQSLAGIERFTTELFGYNVLQSTRPQTLAYSLADSPVGQLAWIVEKFQEWTDPRAALPEEAVDRDQMLTNVMLYWLTGTAGSAANMYYENAHGGVWGPSVRNEVPTGVVNFGGDVAIRRYGEAGNHIVHWTEYERGATSRRWRHRTCWWRTSGRSSARCGKRRRHSGARRGRPKGERGMRKSEWGVGPQFSLRSAFRVPPSHFGRQGGLRLGQRLVQIAERIGIRGRAVAGKSGGVQVGSRSRATAWAPLAWPGCPSKAARDPEACAGSIAARGGGSVGGQGLALLGRRPPRWRIRGAAAEPLPVLWSWSTGCWARTITC